MTAPSTLPAEVQAVVRALANGPSHLMDHKQAAITAAFQHGVIEASAHNGQGHTLYCLRGRAAG